MEFCSNQCHRAFQAVIIGTSPIAICLLIIGFIRIIIRLLEISCSRRRKHLDRRRSSSLFYQSGRPTILYTPVSITELQRIIQGDHQTQQPIDSTHKTEKDSPKPSKFMKSLLSKRESPPTSTTTIANLIGRRNAINTMPFTALFAPISLTQTPQVDIVNEEKVQRPRFTLNKSDSCEKLTISATHTNSCRIDRTDSSESELTDTDPLIILPVRTKITANSNHVTEDSPDFHSARSVPYLIN